MDLPLQRVGILLKSLLLQELAKCTQRQALYINNNSHGWKVAGSDRITPQSMMPTLPSRESSDINLECNKTA
jgi:hypothetical protein